MKTEENSTRLSSLNLKWKHWYWYLLVLFNASIPFFLTINRIVLSKEGNTSTPSQLSLLILAPPISAILFGIYIYSTLKFYNEHKPVIKDHRIRHLRFGIIPSIISFCIFFIALLLSYKSTVDVLSVKIVVYTFLGLSCVLGTLSSVFITMWEFCISFDVFYSKNKEAIIKEYLNRQEGLKIEPEELNES